MNLEEYWEMNGKIKSKEESWEDRNSSAFQNVCITFSEGLGYRKKYF